MYATHRGITINASIVSTMLTNLGTPQATPEYITTAQLDRGIGNINRSYRSTVRTFLVKNGLMEAKRAKHLSFHAVFRLFGLPWQGVPVPFCVSGS